MRILFALLALALLSCATADPITAMGDGTYRVIAHGSYGGRSHDMEVAADAADDFCRDKDLKVQTIDGKGYAANFDPTSAIIVFRCVPHAAAE